MKKHLEKMEEERIKNITKMKNTKNNLLVTYCTKTNGITLIALVVTIVVLLILAGVTITLIFGDNNIFDLAKEAGNKTNEAIKSDQAQIDELNKWLNENGWSSGNGGSEEKPENPDPSTPEEPETPTTPKVLEVGSSVTYTPSGTYNWLHKYCSSTKAEKAEDGTDAYDLLESGTGKDFNISTWNVLSIDEANKKVTLVPTAPTSGKANLQGAQGYNNGVKLLNEACSKLYGNDAKGITARSIKIEDIEGHMTETALTSAHSYGYDVTYGSQATSPYTANKEYPVIYAQEIDAVIDSAPRKTTGLGLSDPPANFIERSKGTSTTSSIGAITTATSIQPYQTYWYKDTAFMQTAFKPYKEGSTYYNLILPKGMYWVASRCVDAHTGHCNFNVFIGSSGSVNAFSITDANSRPEDRSCALFPVVTLSSELLKPGTETDFIVQLQEQ